MSDDQGRDQMEAASALDVLAVRLSDERRQIAGAESQRHAALVSQLLEAGALSREKLANITLPRASDVVLRPERDDRATPWQQFLDRPMRSLGLNVRGLPYDFEFTKIIDHGSPNADKTTGDMALEVSSGGTPGDTSSTFNTCAIGVRFSPSPGAAMIRVAPFLPTASRGTTTRHSGSPTTGGSCASSSAGRVAVR